MIPRFSIIVPIYNVEKYLRKCINSLLEQRYKAFEIILVDDGSPDRCPDICDSYLQKDNRIKVIHKENGGLVSARKAGCEVAIGEYILNVDGDDWVVPEYLKRISDIIDKYHPDCVCFGTKRIENEKVRNCPLSLESGFYDRFSIENIIFPILIESKEGIYFSPSICSKAIKRKIYTKYQMIINDKIRIGEDQACTKPVIYHSKSVYIMSDCLYCYRINPVSMTKEKKPFSWEVPELLGKHFEKTIRLDEFDFQEQVYRNVVHNLFNVAVSQFYGKESYFVTVKNIHNNLKRHYYEKAIINCKYKKYKGRLAQFALKYHAYFIMFLWGKLK